MKINKALAVIAEIKNFAKSMNRGIELNELQLFGAFYKAHLEYAKLSPGFLTSYPIVKLPSGPGIYNFDELKKKQITEDVLQLQENMCNDVNAISAIREGVFWVLDGKMSYDKSWSWLNGQNGEDLDIYVDLDTFEEYEANKKLHDDLLIEAEQIFKDLDRKEV